MRAARPTNSRVTFQPHTHMQSTGLITHSRLLFARTGIMTAQGGKCAKCGLVVVSRRRATSVQITKGGLEGGQLRYSQDWKKCGVYKCWSVLYKDKQCHNQKDKTKHMTVETCHTLVDVLISESQQRFVVYLPSHSFIHSFILLNHTQITAPHSPVI